jgi:hypothetical protein
LHGHHLPSYSPFSILIEFNKGGGGAGNGWQWLAKEPFEPTDLNRLITLTVPQFLIRAIARLQD